MIRAVFFDVGGTLIHAWPSVGAVYARVGRPFGLDASEEAMEHAFRSAWQATKAQGRLTTSDKNWWRQLVFCALESQGFPARLDYFEALYQAFTRADAWRIYPDVVETLRAVRAKGVHVGVISNWDERLEPLLENLGLLEYFDSLTISCDVGVEKPDAAIFDSALATAGVAAGQAVHAGDSEREDVNGAAAVGMRAVLIRRDGAEGTHALGRVAALCG